MPTDQAVALLRRREANTHTHADIHELDTAYLASCRESALQAAQLLGWKVIPCVDASGRCVRWRAFRKKSGPWQPLCCDSWAVRVNKIRRSFDGLFIPGPRL